MCNTSYPTSEWHISGILLRKIKVTAKSTVYLIFFQGDNCPALVTSCYLLYIPRISLDKLHMLLLIRYLPTKENELKIFC